MIFGDGTFFEGLKRGMTNFTDTVEKFTKPIGELRRMMNNRVAQPPPEATTGMYQGGIVRKTTKPKKATAIPKATKKP